MTPSKRGEAYLPPGPARDLADLLKRLRDSCLLSVSQIANRTGYSRSHISEVLRGWKAPSPDAAARIAQALGADSNAAMRARRYAEAWQQHRRDVGGRGPDDAIDGERARPSAARFPIRRQLSNPDVAVNILVGDLLDQDTHIAVGFSDTFDTSIVDNRVINRSSIQGQLLLRLFNGDQARLDDQLTAALAHITPLAVESPSDKAYGKLNRYPLGTVAVFGAPQQLVFAVAYGYMGNDLMVRAPVDGLWHCYTHLWDAVYRHGQRAALSIPLMGAGLARIDTLDRSNLLQLILLSFIAYSRQRTICHELRIVIHPDQIQRIDPASLVTFLKTL